MEHEVPFVPKEDVTIVGIGDSLETTAIRSLLEGYNYRVNTHWIGSKKELINILNGEISTDKLLVLSCHGVEAGITIPNEPPLGPQEIESVARLRDKVIISTGCLTGTSAYSQAFKQAGVASYIAPDDYPEGKATLLFISNFFYLLSSGQSTEQAVRKAADFDSGTVQFKLLV